MACRGGRPLLDRRRRAAARRRSRRARGQRRHAARPRRPQGLRAALGRAAPRRDRQGPRDPRGRDRALPRRAGRPRGRAARHVAARARRRRARAASSSASAPSSRGSIPTRATLVEALTQGIVNKLLHEPTVRVKDAAGTPRGDYYADALGALFDLPDCRIARGADDAHRDARQPARALAGRARRRAARAAMSSTCSSTTTRRSRPDAPTSTRSAGTGVFVKEVQQAVLDGRADLAVHSAKDLPADDRRRASCSRRFPSGPTRATRSSASTLDAHPDRRARRHRLGAPAGAARGSSGPTSRSGRCAATSRRGCASASTKGYDAVVVALRRARPARPRATEVDRGARPVGDAAAGRARRARRSSAAPTTRDTRDASRRSTTPTRTARSTPSGRSSPSSAAGATCPCGALATIADGDRSRSTRCSRRSTATSCCARASTGAIAEDVGGAAATRPARRQGRPRACSTPKESRRDRVPRRRRARRSRAAHAARRGAAARAPTSSSTTGSRRRRCSTSRRPTAERVDVGKAPGRVAMNAGRRSTTLLVDARARQARRSCG